MKALKHSELRDLTSAHGRPCISLYFSFNAIDESDTAAAKRFETLVHDTQHALHQRPGKLSDARLIDGLIAMKPTDFLEHTRLKQGILCIFVSPGIAGYLIVDDRLSQHHHGQDRTHGPVTGAARVTGTHPGKALAYIGEFFHLTPILPLIQQDDGFIALAVTSKNICLYVGDSAEFTLKDRVAFAFESDIHSHDRQATISYGELIQQGIKPEVATHLLAEQDRNPELWKSISLANFMKTAQEVLRILNPFIEDSLRVLILSGASPWMGALRAVLAASPQLQARKIHRTVGQLPLLPIDQLGHRARELVRSTVRQEALVAWTKAHHQLGHQQPRVKLYSRIDEIQKSVEEGNSEVLFTAPDCNSIDGPIESVLNRRGRVYVIDPYDLKFASSATGLEIPASLVNEKLNMPNQPTLERGTL